MYSAFIWIRAWQMPVHWFCSPWIHQFAWASVANNHSPGELANSCESGSLAPHPKSHAYLYPPGRKPLTEMLGYHVLQRKRQHLVFTPAHPVGSRGSWFKKKQKSPNHSFWESQLHRIHRKSFFQNVKIPFTLLRYLILMNPFFPVVLWAFKVRTMTDLSMCPSYLLLCSTHCRCSVILWLAIILSANYAHHILVIHINRGEIYLCWELSL